MFSFTKEKLLPWSHCHGRGCLYGPAEGELQDLACDSFFLSSRTYSAMWFPRKGSRTFASAHQVFGQSRAFCCVHLSCDLFRLLVFSHILRLAAERDVLFCSKKSLKVTTFPFLPLIIHIIGCFRLERSMASTCSSDHRVMRTEGPCGCVVEVGSSQAGATPANTTSPKCSCTCCGHNCRCTETKGRCDCAERMEAAAKKDQPTTICAEAPKGCALELGGSDVCATCGRKGCRCIALKGRCECPVTSTGCCTPEAGVEEACPTCNRTGCRCIALKGHCGCAK